MTIKFLFSKRRSNITFFFLYQSRKIQHHVSITNIECLTILLRASDLNVYLSKALLCRHVSSAFLAFKTVFFKSQRLS